MHLIVCSDKLARTYSFRCNRWYHVLPPVIVLCAMLATAAASGWVLASKNGGGPGLAQWRQELSEQRDVLEAMHAQSQAETGSLSQRLGSLQAHMNRLDALGTRLVHLSGLDSAEFDFSAEPGVGGPRSVVSGELSGLSGLTAQLEGLAKRMEDREMQLRVLDEILLSRNLLEQVVPSGKPVVSGWVSSPYGKRKDPFTGEAEFHRGVDIAGKEGADVHAVAGGIVTRAEARSGYGYYIELDHGGGLRTRYGHSKRLLVEAGDLVTKGQVIATLGSTGRSTGPHVHFEVVRNGRSVNPARYLTAPTSDRRDSPSGSSS